LLPFPFISRLGFACQHPPIFMANLMRKERKRTYHFLLATIKRIFKCLQLNAGEAFAILALSLGDYKTGPNKDRDSTKVAITNPFRFTALKADYSKDFQ
jgi:hypothetical protein